MYLKKDKLDCKSYSCQSHEQLQPIRSSQRQAAMFGQQAKAKQQRKADGLISKKTTKVRIMEHVHCLCSCCVQELRFMTET